MPIACIFVLCVYEEKTEEKNPVEVRVRMRHLLIYTKLKCLILFFHE